nr:PREDICTED: exportin-7 [Apteryx mantelli mantelli]
MQPLRLPCPRSQPGKRPLPAAREKLFPMSFPFAATRKAPDRKCQPGWGLQRQAPLPRRGHSAGANGPRFGFPGWSILQVPVLSSLAREKSASKSDMSVRQGWRFLMPPLLPGTLGCPGSRTRTMPLGRGSAPAGQARIPRSRLPGLHASRQGELSRVLPGHSLLQCAPDHTLARTHTRTRRASKTQAPSDSNPARRSDRPGTLPSPPPGCPCGAIGEGFPSESPAAQSTAAASEERGSLSPARTAPVSARARGRTRPLSSVPCPLLRGDRRLLPPPAGKDCGHPRPGHSPTKRTMQKAFAKIMLQSLAQLENLCKQLYETTDTATRLQAEKALVEFTNSPDCLSKCQLLLERGSSSYSQLLAATCLTKLVSRTNNPLPLEQRIDIRNYVLNYLATRPKLATFVTQALIQLYARITKLGWFDCQKDEYVFRNVITDVTRFLQDSVEHCIIGVTILSQLTNEINQADTTHPLTKHRKIASSFRDSSLFDIFTLSCNLLKQASGKNLNLNDESQHGLLMQLLKLTHNCLNFDFIGTSTDESSDDLCTVQIPTSWRSAFLDSSTLQLFFDLYHSIPPSFSPLVLSCLVQIASVRRSLFNNAERAKFLSHLVDGVKRILENPQSLSDPNNYHEFCRLLARLKSNYQLGELVKVENYPEVIRLIANFTVTSLQHWEFAPNSVHYLLSLWQRLAASVPYVKATEPHMLETYTPEVTKAYITSRLESVHIILRDGLEDPLDDTGLVQQQLDQLSTIGRCEYEKTCALLVQLFDQSAQSYQELLQSATASPMDVAVQEGRLTWLVYIIGAVIGGRVSFASTDEQDAMDGELVCRVLQLMNLTDSRLAQAGNEKLELAMLSFFEQFRKIYIGDQVQKSSKLYRRLSEVLGLNDETMVLSVFIGKIITNLKYWGRCEPITSKTLQLLNDLSIGYSSVRKLVKLSAVQFMLNNHTSEHFSFLGINNQSNLTDMRCRTTFYTALGRLLMVDLGEDEDQYEQFMLPLTAAFETVAQMFSTNTFNEQEAKRTLVGLVRDLRGIAFAFNAKTSFMMLFEWIYPSYMPILQRAIELWYHDPACTTPVLKLMAELVHNRSQRLQFDVSSPNGILLFRETSKMITTYGNRILTLGEVPKDQVYALKLKGISICFSMLKAALSGSYVNFGVFRLYGDDALDNALQTFIKLLLSIPHSDLLDYPKLSQSYYSLLEVLTQDHMNFIASLEPHVIMYILSSISEGLTALDTMVCTGCCSCLDHIVTYLFKQLSRSTKKRTTPLTQESDRFLHIMQQHPEMIQQMLSTVLNIIIFEDCRNQWSMSRPLLGLILLNEKYFSDLRNSIVNSQPPEKQQAMHLCFENLMEGIERNLLTKNRDRFTQNLSAFRREVNDSMKNSTYGVNSNDMMS